MEKEIEKAIRETLVIGNPQSINIAVKKILLLFSVSGRSEQLADHQCKFYVNADWTKLKCECGKEQQPGG